MENVYNVGITFDKNWDAADEPKTTVPKTSTAENDSIFLKDVAQSRCFTVNISGFPKFSLPTGSYGDFLPVKNMSLAFTNYDNLSIPFQIFGDLPLLNRKKVSTIQLTCYDTDDDKLEKAVQAWGATCFPKNIYVAYLGDIARTFQYKSYNVKGKLNYQRNLTVIPAGSVSTSRSYEENSAKLVTFSLVVVGEVGASANGSTNTLKELGYGNGNETAT